MGATRFYDEATGWSSWRNEYAAYWNPSNDWHQYNAYKPGFLWRADTSEVMKYSSLFAPSMSTDNVVDILYGSTPTPVVVEHCDEDVDCAFIDDLI